MRGGQDCFAPGSSNSRERYQASPRGVLQALEHGEQVPGIKKQAGGEGWKAKSPTKKADCVGLLGLLVAGDLGMRR